MMHPSRPVSFSGTFVDAVDDSEVRGVLEIVCNLARNIKQENMTALVSEFVSGN